MQKAFPREACMKFSAAILAAGFGTRMRSPIPKMAAPVLGEPLLRYPYDAVCQMVPPASAIFVVAGKDPVESLLPPGVLWVHQHVMDGTLGAVEAVMMSNDFRNGGFSHLLVLNGDAPLVNAAMLGEFLDASAQDPDAFWFVSAILPDAGRYGRVVRERDGRIVAVREWVDLSREEEKIGEVNAGIYLIPLDFLNSGISRIAPHPEKKERFLTSLFALAGKEGLPVRAFPAGPESVLGVNSQRELAEASRILQDRINGEWMDRGVTFLDPRTTYVGPSVRIGPGTILFPGVVLEGETTIAESCRIGLSSHLRNVRAGAGVHIRDHCVISDTEIEEEAIIGPFAHLRPGSHLERGSHIGNFVETKKVRMGRGAKANHLAYLGDAVVGEGTNIGAGTITCNYDGVSKHETRIGKNVFVGSDSQLVAPVSVGDGAVIGAGSTVTKDVPENAMCISRSPQKVFPEKGASWKDRLLKDREKKKED